MKHLYYIVIITLLGCHPIQRNIKQVSTIDSTMQINVAFILESKLSEINALSGQVTIMEVQTGQIKAMIGFTRKDSANYQLSDNFAVQQPTGLMQPISLLVALEAGKVNLSDTVNAGNGIYSIHGTELKDHNWHRGGYGEMTVKQGLVVSSNIAIYKTVEAAFGNNPQSYFDLLNKMSYGKPDSFVEISNLKPAYFVTPKDKDWNDTAFAWFSIGYNQLISPIQVLTFYNAIANNGKMVQPQLYRDSTIVINPQIANKASIDSLQIALAFNVTNGLGKLAFSEKIAVAGMQGTVQVSEQDDNTEDRMNTEYAAEFCGYFPTDNPKYTIIVSINKTGLPVSGGLMAGDVFKKIVDYMVDESLLMKGEILAYINSVRGHEEKEAICGNFTGKGNDSLFVKRTDEENTFTIVSSNPNMPTLTVRNTLSVSLVDERDLDGNGTTEVGILDTWHTSACRYYRIYTLHHNQWCYLIPPLYTSLNLRESGVELAEPVGVKGKIRIRYSDMNANLSSCSWAPIKDTIISVMLEPVEQIDGIYDALGNKSKKTEIEKLL